MIVLGDVAGHLAEQVQIPNSPVHINGSIDIRLFVARKDVEEGAFSRPRGTHNGDEGSTGELAIYFVEDLLLSYKSEEKMKMKLSTF